MAADEPLSQSDEMYLKVLHRLQAQDRVARVRDVAAELGVTPGSASAALKKLKLRGWVEHQRYGFATLTDAGTQAAELVLRRYEILRDVLIELFGLDPDTADEDACAMEHVVGPTTIERMRATLEQFRGGKLDRARPRS